ncbi:RagB/SusD family nutrient uptake outer membrane protein [Mangrovibacterium diazotrophicum]|uniref:SusD-like starch-binding protein associating with outer membrane n=1 Tax=Mangrovibacterium diazotrophicum TaxID=1261403 RepID=A0A419VYE5_9BACT|nr:RagB/SusD family nutrient uptake outer membrane protein [Mangrovibacterium diazotrophicum]RKD88263.1 SusD-like starch-binding protein associating with outer membrane [Mangrovibacterium diazotrophicum]
MKKTNFSKIVSLAFLVLVLASCDNYLTFDDPDDKTVPGEYYTSAEEIEQGIIGAYVDLRRALVTNHAWLMYGEARTGELTVDVDFYDDVVSQDLKADNYDLQQVTDWGYFYDAINDANEMLEVVENADSDILSTYQYKLFKGEALAVKSMSYFYLARIWGNILSAESASFGSALSETEAVELAVGFASAAQDLLPWKLLNSDGIESTALTAVRFSKTSAITLLAQEDLWLGNSDEAYTALIATTAEELSDSLSTFGLSTGNDRRTDVDEDPLDGSMVWISLTELNQIYPEGDSRRDNMFSISEDDELATLKVSDESVLPLFSTANIQLMLAEAAWKNNDLVEAISFLQAAADGATEDYSGLDEDSFADALLLERQRLLMGTGQRFFDLIRFGKVADVVTVFTTQDVANGAAYWPLSQETMSGNSLNQNIYWSN